jgi:DNA-binding MarR family transcriptional regulator
VNPHLTRVELAEVLGISRQASGGISQRLHKAGLIDRSGQGPGLPVSFTVATSGRQHLTRAAPIVTATERRILDSLRAPTATSLVAAVYELIEEMT